MLFATLAASYERQQVHSSQTMIPRQLYTFTYLQLLEDCIRQPPNLGIESENVDHTVSRRVRGDIRPRTELFPVLQRLFGLQNKRDKMRLLWT